MMWLSLSTRRENNSNKKNNKKTQQTIKISKSKFNPNTTTWTWG